MWAYSLEGRVFDFDGRKLKIEEQLSEVLDMRMGQRHVLAKARNIDNQKPSLLKIRYQLDPKYFDFDDLNDEILEIAEQHYCHEVEATILLSKAGLGPKYLKHQTQDQPEWMPFPDGYVDFIVMKPPPGENLDEIHEELTDRQLASIRTQLAHILETMRQNSYKLIQEHPSYLNYDARTNKLYLIDLEGLAFTDPTSSTSFPVDEESPFVEAFNIWRAPYRKPEEGPSGKQPTKLKSRPPWRA
ncbi:uncharacterized protein BO80DRAFT_488488 [Aspergillus ibericus CBS 121593]|uniref:Protein kinase domain-containing protein n=1 Tax=Aspergillus ibericus CBS 121593 TaxID=1448316 RepID=A0A395H6E6_9EURO|nr:hypothetical protein BO80DRAFT_488488 [Aspergillus ibericus CBS 121593]RAL03492.1 hypothetical protein BO80DRAFT_488488 [Aspergillus ibericus CBS 121593]